MSDTTSTPFGSPPGVESPLDGLLAASREHRLEALDHFLVAADELVQATKSIVEAAEAALEFGKAWAIRERSASDGNEMSQDSTDETAGRVEEGDLVEDVEFSQRVRRVSERQKAL